MTIGLAQGLCKLGKKAVAAIREPSLGPVFGMKGGAAGGGHAQVLPMEDINLHFTGDMHALGSGEQPAGGDDRQPYLQGQRAGDGRADSRAQALPGHERPRPARDRGRAWAARANGYPRESGFQITVASEVMAILCLAESLAELKERLGRIVVGQTVKGQPITAADLGAQGAMAALLRDAIKPNLVQTLEGTPAFVHGGPFGNIAHGCSSVLGTKLALRLGEYVVTEAGFGSDLGFEKFCDIVAAPRQPALSPDAVVLIATVRALKMHGGVAKDASEPRRRGGRQARPAEPGPSCGECRPDRRAVRGDGQHVHLRTRPPKSRPSSRTAGSKAGASRSTTSGPRAARAGANWGRPCWTLWRRRAQFQPIYDASLPIPEKLHAIATKVYGADGVEISAEAEKQIAWLDSARLRPAAGLCRQDAVLVQRRHDQARRSDRVSRSTSAP